MKIMHYFLGFPPYRSGGATIYSFDLMITQVADKNDVIALWPGKIKNYKGKPFIKKCKKNHGIGSYELVNPLPIPLDEGINKIYAYMRTCDISMYIAFLVQINPEVIHIHTLMGLHREFIIAANKLKIKMVFTTHDYFGICPRVTLYKFQKVCDNDHNCMDCIQCNSRALSLNKIKIMQSPFYRIFKNIKLFKLFRNMHRNNFFLSDAILSKGNENYEDFSKKYFELRQYYISMFEMIDLIHFNSSVSEKIFKKYINPKNSIVMSITHKSIIDNRNLFKWHPSTKLRIVYLASNKPFKGFLTLQKALDNLWNDGNHNFLLKVFCPVQNPAPYMIVKKKGYEYSELKNIMAEADVLVAPSEWYETFGFTVLEAISFGVPVIISRNVGAKDIINDFGIVINANSVDELIKAILAMTYDEQKKFRKNIQEQAKIKTWSNFNKENYYLYY